MSTDKTDSGWRKRQIALDQKAENARELGLDYAPDKTIEMARKAGFMAFEYPALIDKKDLKKLESFAALVRADEREACAKIADSQLLNTNALLTAPIQSSAAYQIGVSIRARGNT